MRFNLVIVPQPPQSSHEAYQRWGAFYGKSGIPNLAQTAGVFSISDSAWLFDMTKALAPYARLIHEAANNQFQLFVFQLPEENPASALLSFPQSDELAKILSSLPSPNGQI